jgi:hypothetical protein
MTKDTSYDMLQPSSLSLARVGRFPIMPHSTHYDFAHLLFSTACSLCHPIHTLQMIFYPFFSFLLYGHISADTHSLSVFLKTTLIFPGIGLLCPALLLYPTVVWLSHLLSCPISLFHTNLSDHHLLHPLNGPMPVWLSKYNAYRSRAL